MDARPFLLLSALIAASILPSCAKEDDGPASDEPATIAFRSDSGYVHTSGTYDAGDTLHVEVTVTKGSEDLRTFFVERRYDNNDAVRFDSVPIDGSPFHYDTVMVLRAQAGTEKWTFIGEEEGGDRSLRSLTITTQ
ncbi:MAG: hypothetical protein JST66_07420 [Bacteroidetes bacterium]|nr:hypothetical protein [Bacteroidota bacterium]